ncbi:MAG: zinc-dependent peptidase [Chitinophagaceae bacterium]|jgi:MtfA peptidase|nr:zinc-dependent peptidase [Chitinophagaceae bacterium]
MVLVLQILLVLFLIILIVLIAFRIRRPKPLHQLPDNYKELLNDYVTFYRELNESGKEHFEQRIDQFLSAVKITGVNAEAEDLDRIFIAAAAIIPVYTIQDWQYINLHEVLLYPGAFNEEFDQHGADRNIAGMVGTGALQYAMVLTKWQVRQGFINNNDTHKTAIHEFVHLIDKMDGTMDGVPEIILERKYIDQWKQLMYTSMQQIKNGQSDIDRYGSTNTAEFFAVISEYFFMQPGQLQSNHPDVFHMLQRIYRTGKNIQHNTL